MNDPYHIRGGQDCSTNKSSAHCLKFDPMWYVQHIYSSSQDCFFFIVQPKIFLVIMLFMGLLWSVDILCPGNYWNISV